MYIMYIHKLNSKCTKNTQKILNETLKKLSLLRLSKLSTKIMFIAYDRLPFFLFLLGLHTP